MNKELGVKTSWGTTEQITSNDYAICFDCKCKITPQNDSGWEVFTSDGRTTQKVCKRCDYIRNENFSGEKQERI